MSGYTPTYTPYLTREDYLDLDPDQTLTLDNNIATNPTIYYDPEDVNFGTISDHGTPNSNSNLSLSAEEVLSLEVRRELRGGSGSVISCGSGLKNVEGVDEGDGLAVPVSLQGQQQPEEGHYSPYNPFSLSNSNCNIDAWEADCFPNHESHNQQTQAQAQIAPKPPTAPTPPALAMDPHQQYYYQGGPQNPYAASSAGPSNPTSPQNGFVPIYSNTGEGHAHAYHQATTTATYASSSTSSNNNSPQTLEEHELKRLRNTAASARFRAKKKQREVALESSAREKKDKLEALEKRIQDLEDENKWLKALIMEKKDVAGEVQRMRERYGVVAEEMKEFEHKDGVGTGN